MKNITKYKIKYMQKKFVKKTFKLVALTSVVTAFGLSYIYQQTSIEKQNQIANNEIQYAKEIEQYDEQLQQYINSLELEGLTDLEIFMLVTNDMWESIDGYQTPEKDVAGYYRLALQEYNIGVCRHMSDDITAKLNAINPAYNARNVAVYTEFGDLIPANINIRKTEECLRQESINQEQSEQEQTLMDKIGDIMVGTPNHVVTLVDIPDQNITLVLDPTNAEIGTLVNGEIKMFNDPKGTYDIINRTNYLLYGEEYSKELVNTQLESFGYDETYEELEELYGLDAQNEALEKVKNM